MPENVAINTEQFFEKSNEDLVIDKERTDLLTKIAQFISDELKASKNVNLNFICTHNSRRSQLCQVWASYATDYFNLKNIDSFSGGTAVTAFYRNTVKTLQQVGFNFEILEFSHQNPVYKISYKNCNKPIVGFSKLYDDSYNKKPFVAITTCSNADENCPFILDAVERFHLPFTDPKISDGTELQEAHYLKTNKQIAGEIYFIFEMIKKSI
jgi:arsenate reductase